MRRVREWMAGGRLPGGDIELAGLSVIRRDPIDGYPDIASLPIVDPEANVRLPLQPSLPK